ncbi:MAG: hypothetical protein U5L11_04825 [Arhodomonas sp.]|nr:hypothetical protein [Arhodomonas sp.]
MSAVIADNTEEHPLAGVVDLGRYPIHQRDGDARDELLRRCRASSTTTVAWCSRASSARRRWPRSARRPASSRREPTTTRPTPTRTTPTATRRFRTTTQERLRRPHQRLRRGDLIAQDTAVRRIYHNPDFQRFIAAALEEPELHEYADPLAGLVINVLRDGCQHPWHYDTNEFIVTMMTQKPERGGDFEYCPHIRSPEDENFQGVQRVLEGDRNPVKTLSLEPGDLQIFDGRYSLHRVARVHGETERHTVIFGYAREPGFIGRAERAQRIFGRMAPVHERQLEEGLERSDNLAD